MNENELARKILVRIGREERRRLILETVAWAAALLGSATFAVFLGIEAIAAASQSGFLSFASLFFSDFSTAMGSFSDFAFSMVESFPVFPVALLLSGVFVTVWSAGRFINEAVLLRHASSTGAAASS